MLLTAKRMANTAVLGVGLLLTGSTFAQTSDLLISEYVEGSSNNKYVEIFNGTNAPIDLSDYQIRLYSNGNSSPNVVNTLSGFLADGDVVVYGNSSATIYNGNVTSLGSMTFNGDDAIELYNAATGTSVDIFGVIGCDPGSQWISASNRTQNRTLRRNSDVLSGATTNPGCTSSSGDFTTLEAEWTEYPQDNVADLGLHFVQNINPPVVDLGPDQALCNGASITLYSGGDGDTFLWSTGETTSSITVNTAGTYSVTVTNAYGSTTDDIIISAAPASTQVSSSASNICSGENVEICATILTDDLFISEYVEGVSLNKCVEIYNGTGAPIDMAAEGYSIDISFNGGTSTYSVPLIGTINHGGTHVLCDDGAGAIFQSVADQTATGNFWNGDDAVVLSKNGVAIDIFGVVNDDPGSEWSSGGNYTQNVILRRNSSVTGGVTTNPTGTGSGAFTTLGPEWTLVTNLSDYLDLGSHTVTGTGNFSWSTGETSLCIDVAPTATTDYTFSYTNELGCTSDLSTTVTVSAPDVNAGGCEVVYFGYAPEECADLMATSSSSVTYSWDNGVSGASQTVCPQTTTNYTVTATDANGCTAQSTVTVNVVDVRCGKKNDKVLVCKVPPGNPSNAHQICVSPNAVAAHLATGSYLGTCGDIDPCSGTAKSNFGIAENAIDVSSFEVTVYPSPLVSGDVLNIAIVGVEGEATIKIISLSGQHLGSKIVQSSSNEESIVEFGTSELSDGVYLCKVVSESGKVSTKRFTILK